jgi:hypothetical protein
MDSPEAGRGLVLYYRENCHLCESMRLALNKLRQQQELSWREVDIDRDTRLIARFDALVPVLYCDGREVCHYFIDPDAIVACLGNA